MTRRDMARYVAGFAAAGATGVTKAAEMDMPGGIKLGVATYSFREFQRHLAISMIKQLKVHYVSVKDFHIPYDVTPEDAEKAKSDFAKAGLKIMSCGNVPLQDEDPALLKRKFEYARLCGMPMMVCAPTHKTLDTVEKLVKEYDIKAALHNHGPEDKHFPTPQSVLEAVKGRDPRMGLCMDLGHSMRTGIDVVQGLASAGSRLLDIHIKDLKVATAKDSQCDVGEGVMPIVAIFKQLQKLRYQGCVNLEYEINADNPLPGMLHSLGYMHGVLVGMAA
jgi:sugar phosphate isomerase/epimerase